MRHSSKAGPDPQADARTGHSFCQGWEPLLKTTPSAKHHQLFCEFCRKHKYYIARRFSSASPGSRCYTHSNVVIRQTSRLVIRKDRGEKGPVSENIRSRVFRCLLRTPNFILILVLSGADNSLTKSKLNTYFRDFNLSHTSKCATLGMNYLFVWG